MSIRHRGLAESLFPVNGSLAGYFILDGGSERLDIELSEMNFTPKVGPLVAELLSGFAVLLLGYFAIYQNGQVPPALHGNAAAAIGIFAILAWLLGTFFDMLRNRIVEWALDECYSKIYWDFFFTGSAEKLANLEHFFFSFYMLDADMAIGLFLFVAIGPYVVSDLGLTPHVSIVFRGVLLIIAGLFAWDAHGLRCEIKRLLDAEKDSTK